MSEERSPQRPSKRVWLRFGLVWLAMMALFGITLATAYLNLGGNSATLHIGIALLQVLILWLVFMDLLKSSAPVRVAAAVGAFWLIFLFCLSFADYFTRDWNGGGTSLSSFPAKVAGGEREGTYPKKRLPLNPRFNPTQ